ncbi:hybrid sensor histidine kinase/response regulator [Desulfovibrio inopinatus]|uniref:hybrid sensor histidine kinase/response regulator n=1 Tax=Desulfovibrio inopinatus TaxID=102109 RepID=UPI00040AC6F6|nr:response regulator [Desulfovibrio inopinatus]
MAFDNPEFLAKLRKAFKHEAVERLANLGKTLISLEEGRDETKRDHLLELAYRETHSLKGAARAVGGFDIEVLSHAMETVFSGMIKNDQSPDESQFDLLHQAVDMLRWFINNPTEEDGPSPEAVRLAGLLNNSETDTPEGHLFDDILTPMSEAELDKNTLAPPPTTSVSTAPLPEESHDTTEPARPPDEKRISDKPHSDAAPSSDRSPSSEPASNQTSSTRIPSSPAKGMGFDTVRVPSSRLEDVLLRGEEMLWLKGALGETARRLTTIKKEMAGLKLAFDSLDANPRAGSAVRHALEHTDDVRRHLDFVEAEIGSLTQSAVKNARSMTVMLDELLDETRRILLEPFSTLFDMLPVIARDIAREQGKKCRLTLIGSQVEIDRRILDELRDVFVHIIRNAVDHGLEKPEKRLAHGKTDAGRIQIRVMRSLGGKTQIEVSDDGIGLDADAVTSKAISLDVISVDAAREISLQEKLNLIFHSGLTTSPLITDISGRGLGLAIAKDKVERMGGSIGVSSFPGKGTTFDITLPSALSSYPGIVIMAGGRHFVIPKGGVEHVIRITPDDIIHALAREGIVHEGVTIPVRRLQTILGLPESELLQSQHLPVLIMTASGRRAAIIVDKIHEEREVMAKQLGPQLRRVRHVAAVTTLAGGLLAPILHVPDMIATASKTSQANQVDKRHQPMREASGRQSTVLVAEDSITSRMLLKNILEAAGYVVKTAIDGVEAFLALRETAPDIVITDVQMPGMDGFELTARIRADAAFANLPVVLVTSLESREDKERGIDAGADAYIVKSGFDQKNLLDVIERLL